MNDLIFSGSVKEDKETFMGAMNNFVDTNSMVERCCWKASRGELEKEEFMEEFIALKEGMVKMKERYTNLQYDRYHLLMVDELYQCAFKKETEESKRLHRKWEATYDSLKRTQGALQESRWHIDQL